MFNPLQFYEFGKSRIEQNHLLNFDATNSDYIVLDTQLQYPGVFDWEFKFSFSAESSGYAPVFGAGVDQSRIIVSQTNSKVIINIGDNNAIQYTFSFLFNTEYIMRIRRDVSNDVYITINGNPEVNIGNRTGTWGAAFGSTYFGKAALRELTGKIYYANLGGNDNYQLNEGSGSTVNSQIGGNSGTITTNQDINYINNTMWELIP